jgi:hypothetical protein
MFRRTDSDHWIMSYVYVVTYVLSCCHTPFYCCAKGHFFHFAGVAMSSAIPAVLTMPTVFRHANVCSGMTASLSLPPQHNPAKQHLRYGHGTHSTACQLLSRGTRSRRELNWHSSRGSSLGVLAWETTRASHHLAVPTLTLLTP